MILTRSGNGASIGGCVGGCPSDILCCWGFERLANYWFVCILLINCSLVTLVSIQASSLSRLRAATPHAEKVALILQLLMWNTSNLPVLVLCLWIFMLPMPHWTTCLSLWMDFCSQVCPSLSPCHFVECIIFIAYDLRRQRIFSRSSPIHFWQDGCCQQSRWLQSIVGHLHGVPVALDVSQSWPQRPGPQGRSNGCLQHLFAARIHGRSHGLETLHCCRWRNQHHLARPGCYHEQPSLRHLDRSFRRHTKPEYIFQVIVNQQGPKWRWVCFNHRGLWLSHLWHPMAPWEEPLRVSHFCCFLWIYRVVYVFVGFVLYRCCCGSL